MNSSQDSANRRQKSSANSLDFTVTIDKATRQLVLLRSSVTVNGATYAASRDGRNGKKAKSTRILRFALLALAEFKYSGRVEFKNDGVWRRFHDCLRKQIESLKDPGNRAAARWAENIFGSI